MIVRELLTRFSFSTDTASQSRLEGTIQRIGGLLGGLAAYASLSSLAGVADAMQSLEARIGMLPQTLGDVGAAFNEISKNATANRQSIDAYGAFYTKVGNAAKGLITDQGQLLKVTNTISQALVVGGASTQEAQAAMMQFGQALGSGVLQGDEFRSMAEAAPQYLDALSEAMNIPREQLKKMASEGKLTSKAVIEATLKMSSMFEDKFKKMPLTVGQATTIIGNRFKTMIQGMNRETGFVTKAAQTILAAFDVIEGGVKNLIKFVGGAENALKLLEIALWAVLVPLGLFGLSKAWGVLKWALAAVTSPLALVVGLLMFLGVLIDDVSVYLNGGSSDLADFIDMLTDTEGTLAGLGTQLMALGLIATAVFSVMRLHLLKTIGYYVGLGLAALIAGAKMAIAGIVAAAPFLLFMAVMALALAAFFGVAYLIKTYWDDIKAAATTAIDSIGEAISSIGSVFKDIFYDTPIRWITEMIPRVIEKLKAIGGKVLTFLGIGDEPAATNGQPRGRGVPPSVAPGGIANAGKPGTTVTSNQTVNLTVPAGTPEAQQKFLKNAAATSFKDPMAKLSNNLAIVAP